ncbi:uncharacterized protein DC041_0004209 [Schistosoma bovis]|uniref:BRCT domain-containing protein n=1 Tax=Schistosoma bovis TaxID=6184 RepID=A0A430QQS5_SCHBO|nr:uncharacterized protein DC041_0004209 [Schistosoma bovis]
MENVLKGVVAYVDVKSSFGNPAIALSASLESLGAKVCHTLSHLVTHVIFRNGSEVVKSWATKRNIPVVSPAWVKASRMMKVKAPEAAYSEKEDGSDLSGLPTKLDNKDNSDVKVINRTGVDISDREYNNGLSVFKPIRVSEKFIRPKTPPGMRDFLLRIQKGQILNAEDTICDETVLMNSKENIENDEPGPNVGEGFQNSNVKSKDQSKVLEFRNSLSPIVNQPQSLVIIDDSIISNSLIENYPVTTNSQQKLSSKFRLINPNVDSPSEQLIVPKIKKTSHLFNEINNQSKKLKRKSSVNSKRISIGTPLTPDVLLDFVSSTHSSKSANTKKHNTESVDNKLDNVQQQIKKSNLLTYRKSTKLFSNLKNSPSVTPKLRSKSILKEANHNSNTTITTTTTNGDDDDHNNTKVKLKTTLSTGKRTPIHKQSRQSTHNSQLKSKSITEKKTNNNEETKNLLASSSRKQNVNSSKDISIQQRKRSMSALCTQTLRPVIVRLPSNVDLDATKIVPCLEESESLNKQQDKSNQTLMVSNSVHKKSCGVTNELLSDNHYKGKSNNNEITPLSTTPKRLSVSQIKTINKRSSLEEFRSTPQIKRKDMSIRSPIASELGATRISIVFSGTQSEEEQVLIALLKSSNLIGYDIIKPSFSHSHLTRTKCKLGTANRSFGLSQFTHLVTESPCRRTLKLFHALIRGAHIVTTDWIRQSPPGLPRLSRMQTMNRLFSNVGIIYVDIDTKPPRQDLVDLLNLGGALLTNRKTEATVLIGCNISNKICIKPKWILDIVQMIAGLAKNVILHLNKNQLLFIIKERSVFGGVTAWCDLDLAILFPERICEGISPDQDEIFLELNIDHLLHCIRPNTQSTSSRNPLYNSTCTSNSYTTVNKSRIGSNSVTGMISNLDQSVCRLLGLKIKLVRRKTPCLAIELDQSSVTGHPRAVWHFIPVQVVPPRLWDEFVEPPDPDFNIISANGSGELNFAVNVETLASVKLTFRGLKARSWMNSESFSTEINDSIDEAHSTIWDSNDVDLDNSKQINNNEDPNKKLVSISLDLRRISQLLSSPRIAPSCFVCNIIHEKLAQFLVLFDNYKLKYNIPASNL